MLWGVIDNIVLPPTREQDKQNQHIFLVVLCPIPWLLIAYTQQLDILRSNQENHEHQKYLRNFVVLQEKSQLDMRNLNLKQKC